MWLLFALISVLFFGPVLLGGLLSIGGMIMFFALGTALFTGATPLLPLLLVGLVVYKMHRGGSWTIQLGKNGEREEREKEKRTDTCPNCGAHVDRDKNVCPTCLADLKDNCPYCGEVVDLRDHKCPHCGRIIKGKVEIEN